MAQIGVCGMGKLGLPVALAIESRGHEVMGYDVSAAPYEYIAGRQIPYTEEGLQPLLDATRIKMTGNLGRLVAENDIIFLPVQTPHDPQYEGATRLPESRKDFDYSYLKEAIGAIAIEAQQQGKQTTLAVISTCLPGTFEREIKPLLNDKVDYVYTPQFIAMGGVVDDYLNPEFNLIGVENEAAADRLESFYSTINDAPNLRTDITTAEGIKVSYNTFITMKTVLANTWGELSHKLGMNVDDIFKAWSLSSKRLLSPRYLQAGVGDGGGCHPRDNIALSYLADQVDLSHNLFEDLMLSREQHMSFIADEALRYAYHQQLPIVVLGRAFKPETNIETGSPAVLLTNILREADQTVENVEDPDDLQPAVYVLGTSHERYQAYDFPVGSVVIDPFRKIKDKNGVTVIRIGDGQTKTTQQTAD